MVSLFSPWYAYRLFSQVLNMTPADYIRRFRLSKSVLMLRDESCKVLDVAMKLGFGSVDGYQRAFFRELGCDPKQYSDTPIPLYLFIPYQATYQSERKKKQMKNVKSVFVQVVDKPARKVIIKRGIRASDYFAYCEEVRCDVWGRLTSIQSINGEPVCLWLPTAFIAPGTFDVIEFPASKYLMFQGEPFPEADYGEAIEQVQAAIAKYDPSIIGYKWNPESPRIQLEPIGSRGYIELLAIK